jgi:hypothetical protein
MGRKTVGYLDAFSTVMTDEDFVFFNDLGEQRVRVGPSQRGGSAGVLWSGDEFSAGASAQLLRREMRGSGDMLRTVTLQSGRSFGSVSVNALVMGGRSEPDEGAPRAVRRVRGTVTWRGTAGSLWLAAENATEGPPLALALNASLRLSRLELTTTLNTFRDSLSLPSTTLSSSAALEIRAGTAVRAGVEYRPWAREQLSPWAVSLGVRHTLAVRLPVAAGATTSGVLFEDTNHNGRQDAGEPGLAGVALTLGPLVTSTDGSGRFSFDEAPAGAISVSQVSLGSGLFARPVTVRGDRHIEIPVVRTGRVIVRVVIDDGNGAEESAPAGVRVRVTDSQGRSRDATTAEDGTVMFESLVPGATEVVVTPPDGRAAADPVSRTINIEPGASAELLVPVLQRARPIRFFESAEPSRRPAGQSPRSPQE